MTNIYLVRHGVYVNPQDLNPFRLEGFPLSKNGIEKISELASFFQDKSIKAIYTSPILRAQQTAKIIAKENGLKPIVSDLLIEVACPFQGKTKTWIVVNIGDFYNNAFHLKNGGETIEQIYSRMKKITDESLLRYRDQNIVFVSHGDPIMILVMQLQGIKVKTVYDIEREPYIPMGGIIKAEFDNQTFKNVMYLY